MADDRNERVSCFDPDWLVLFGREGTRGIISRNPQGNREIAKIVEQFKQDMIEQEKAIEELSDQRKAINQVAHQPVAKFTQNSNFIDIWRT